MSRFHAFRVENDVLATSYPIYYYTYRVGPCWATLHKKKFDRLYIKSSIMDSEPRWAPKLCIKTNVHQLMV